MRAEVDTLTDAVHDLKAVVLNFASHMNTGYTYATNPPSNATALTIRIPPRNMHSPVAAIPATSISPLPVTTKATAHPPTQFRALAPCPPMSRQPHGQSLSTSHALNTLQPRVMAPDHNPIAAPTGHTRSLSRRLPEAGLVIPHVPIILPDGTRRPRSESWRDIIEHWTNGAPNLELHTALKDWPPEWIQGHNRVFATKYFERSVIAREFIDTFHSDDAAFLTAYPEANRGHTALLRAINNAREERGERVQRTPRRNCQRPSARGQAGSSSAATSSHTPRRHRRASAVPPQS